MADELEPTYRKLNVEEPSWLKEDFRHIDIDELYRSIDISSNKFKLPDDYLESDEYLID
jgi:hypothetical protein